MNDIKIFGEKKQFFSYLFHSAKILLIVCSFLFFLAYSALSSGFYGYIFLPYFLYLYTAFVISFSLFLASFILHFGYKKIPFPVLILLAILLLALGGVFLFPIL